MTSKTSTVNQYFDQVYVLNLEKRTDRKIAMLQKLQRLGIEAEFVQAVNGSSAQNQLEYQAYLETPIGSKGCHHLELEYQKKLVDGPGAWACLKSYIGILRHAKARNYQRILCLEDDVIFHQDFENQFKKATQQVPEDWKLLYLGASQYVWRIPEGLSYPDKTKVSFDPDAPYYYPKVTDGAFAIGIHSSVFDLLLKETLKMNCAFDSGPLRAVNKKYPRECFVIHPNIVIADVSESDIRGGQNLGKLGEQLKWKFEDFEVAFQKDLVSVIMPACNAEKTIEKSIRSVLLQTYSELELIVVDDGSTDQTALIVGALAEEDPRIRLVSLKENQGVGAARNAGLKMSRGRVIAIQDADDISLRQRLEKQLIPIYAKGVMVTLSRMYRSRCDPEELDVFDQETMLALVESKRVKMKSGDFSYEDSAVVGLVTTVYRRSVFEEYGLFEEHRFGEDMEFLERFLFFKASADFSEKHNAHSFVNYGEPFVPDTFARIEEVLLISPQLSSANLTSQFKNRKKEVRRNEQQFREKYRSQDVAAFPKLIPLQEDRSSFPSLSYPDIAIDELVMVPQSPHSQQSYLSEHGSGDTDSTKPIGPFIFKVKKFWRSPLYNFKRLIKAWFKG